MKRYTTPIKVSLILLVFGSAWILISDRITDDAITLWLNIETEAYQTAKGLLFVLIISVLSFVVIERQERFLFRSKDAYRKFFYQNPGALVLLTTPDHAIEALNKNAENLLGLLESDNGEALLSDILPEVHVFIDNLNLDTDHHDDPHSIVEIQREGNVHKIRIMLTRISLEQKEYLLLGLEDLTGVLKVQLLEEELESEKLFSTAHIEAIINSSRDFIWSIDQEMKLLSANDAFVKWEKEVLQKELFEGADMTRPGSDAQLSANWVRHYQKALSGRELRVNQVYRDASNNKRLYDCTLTPLRVQDSVIGVVCCGRDVTELAQNIARNTKYKQVFYEISFINSHELRKPVANMIGLVGIISQAMETNDFETVKNTKEYLNHSLRELDAYIRKISDLTSHQKMEPHPDDVSVLPLEVFESSDG